MTDHTKMMCGNCKFFVKEPLQPKQGSCHVKSPTPIPVPAAPGQIQMLGVWPPVMDSLWCGEYQLKVNFQ
jgi:hypothetical protein